MRNKRLCPQRKTRLLRADGLVVSARETPTLDNVLTLRGFYKAWEDERNTMRTTPCVVNRSKTLSTCGAVLWVSAMGASPELIRKKLAQVMNEGENFRRSATASFRYTAK